MISSQLKRGKICKSLIMLGSSFVGKTSIIQRFIKEAFDSAYIKTLGVDYYSKELLTKQGPINLSIWDTSGLESELRILPSNIYKRTNAYIITCSYDSEESFNDIRLWIDHINSFTSGRDRLNTIIMILINKSDIKKERKFKIEDIKAIDAVSLLRNVVIYEVSARDNIRIQFTFEQLTGFITGGNVNINRESNGEYDALGVFSSVRLGKERSRSFQIKEDAYIPIGRIKQRSCCV